MTVQADPGQVAPGTQSPLEVVYPVSKTEQSPTVEGYTPERLADLFAGTRDRGLRVEDEYALFTDKTSADNYAKRQELLHKGAFLLRQMSIEQLEEIVPALESDKVEDTIESINRYTE
jgi:hypothetical protein